MKFERQPACGFLKSQSFTPVELEGHRYLDTRFRAPVVTSPGIEGSQKMLQT